MGGDGSRRAAEALSRAAILPSAQGALCVFLLPRFRGAFFLQWDGAAACGDHVTPAGKSAGNFTLEPGKLEHVSLGPGLPGGAVGTKRA